MPVLLDRPEIQDQSDTSVSATSVALFAQCPRRYYLSRYLGFDLPKQTSEAHPPDEMDSTEFGRNVHALLAGALPRESATPEALALIANFESSIWGRRAASADHLEREQSFLVSLDGRLLSGQIDLWFRESGETILIDYKTDDVTAQQAPHRAADYELQLRLYALAIQRLSGTSPDRAILYFLRPNLAFDVSLDRSSLDAARVKVEELFQAQSRVAFPLRVGEHCFRCPHFHGICPAR